VIRSRPLLPVASFFMACLSIGCAAKRPISANPQPPPAQPSATPGSTAEAAKRDTGVSPAKRAKTPPLPAPVGYTEEGNASWYGNPFHGRRSSNGEIYDMYQL